VFQLRSDMPREIGCIYWRTTAEPATSVFTPWYLGINETLNSYWRGADVKTQLSLDHHFSPPEGTFELDPSLAWWTFKTLQDLVHQDYDARIKIVRPVWAKFETRLFDNQPAVEKKALALWQTDQAAARAFLTKYCADVAAEACSNAEKLTEALQNK